MGVGADGAADLADAHRLAGRLQAPPVAQHLLMPERELKAQAGRLAVDAVRAPDDRLAFQFQRPALQHDDHGVHFFQDQVEGLDHADGLGGVHHVGGGQAHVDEPRVGADVFGQGRGERDHVVMDHVLDRQNAMDGERGLFLDFGKGVVGDFPQSVPSLAGQDLDLEPRLELGLLAPKLDHFGRL